jgi:hypothetical protein
MPTTIKRTGLASTRETCAGASLDLGRRVQRRVTSVSDLSVSGLAPEACNAAVPERNRLYHGRSVDPSRRLASVGRDATATADHKQAAPKTVPTKFPTAEQELSGLSTRILLLSNGLHRSPLYNHSAVGHKRHSRTQNHALTGEPVQWEPSIGARIVMVSC